MKLASATPNILRDVMPLKILPPPSGSFFETFLLFMSIMSIKIILRWIFCRRPLRPTQRSGGGFRTNSENGYIVPISSLAMVQVMASPSSSVAVPPRTAGHSGLPVMPVNV